MKRRYPFLLSIPHGGEVIPPEVQGRTAITRRDILYTGDPETRRLYNFRKHVAACSTTEIARLIVDLNRAPYYAPFMSPDGIIKRVTHEGLPVYREGMYPDRRLIRELLAKYYYPYHRDILAALRTGDIRLALDCHSMLPYPPPMAGGEKRPRPLFCLSNGGDLQGKPTRSGTVTCPPAWLSELAEAFREEFRGEGDVALNNPFRGGFISQAHYRHTGVPWMQVEINRGIYESDGVFDPAEVAADTSLIRDLSGRIFSAIASFWNSLPDEEAGTD